MDVDAILNNWYIAVKVARNGTEAAELTQAPEIALDIPDCLSVSLTRCTYEVITYDQLCTILEAELEDANLHSYTGIFRMVYESALLYLDSEQSKSLVYDFARKINL